MRPPTPQEFVNGNDAMPDMITPEMQESLKKEGFVVMQKKAADAQVARIKTLEKALSKKYQEAATFKQRLERVINILIDEGVDTGDEG